MGNPFAHIELSTDDVGRAQKFYKAVFDWKLKPMGPYVFVDPGKGTSGGIQKKSMPGAPTAWLPYVEVRSVKKSVAKAKKLGARVAVEYMLIGDMGAIGVFMDPTGGAIGVWEAAKKPGKKAKKAAKAAKKAAEKAAKKAAAKSPKKRAKKPAKKKAKAAKKK